MNSSWKIFGDILVRKEYDHKITWNLKKRKQETQNTSIHPQYKTKTETTLT